MNIFSYFQKNGIDTVDASFYRKIKQWKSWYNSDVRSFYFYRVYSGQGTSTRCRRKSMGMAKKLAEDIADILLNEKVSITLSDQQTDTYVRQVLKNNRFGFLGNEYQERKACTGTVAYVPYLDDLELSDDGSILSGKIGMNYVSADNIYPISWHNGIITEVAFTFPKTVNRRRYMLVQLHKIVGCQYVIENSVIECVTGSREGKELTEAEWKQLRPFRTLVPRLETGSSEPQFVIDKLNLVNNADEDESNPMGIAIFANALDIVQKIDIEYDSYCNEFELGRKRIFVAPEMLHNDDKSLAFDPNDTVFYKLPDGYADGEEKRPIVEVDMSIRAEEHSRAINDDLNYLSLKCGFGPNRYRFENGQLKTATEVISENSDMFRTLRKHELILDDVLKQLIQIIIRLGIVLGNPLNPETEIRIDFDDSIIEDKQAERNTDRQDVAMGSMALWEYRAKWFGETEDKAKAAVQDLAGVIE